MVYRTNLKIGRQISLLGFGAMRLPVREDGTIDRILAEQMIDRAYRNGVNYFDTAYMYHGGESQDLLGEILQKYPRDSFYLTNKMPVWMAKTREDVERIFNDQLSRCKVDYFDFYLIHSVLKEHLPKIRDFGVYEFLAEKKREGKIRQLGFSFHDTPEVLEQVCSTWEFDFAQIQLNYLDWEYQHAREQYEILCRHGLPCVVMEPVRGGALANLPPNAAKILKDADPEVSAASWAIRFAASLPNVMTVLSGMSTEQQVDDNLKTMQNFRPLSEQEHEVLKRALERYRENRLIPCTGCHYCSDCPSRIAIPDIFRVYNEYAITGDRETFLEDLRETGGSDQCLQCGACASVCPQHIQIPEQLEKIRDLEVSLA